MQQFDVLKDISERTGGDIYIGTVGPVRTGKSTFIKKVMELLVLPNIDDEHDRTRVTDELPQSGAGKTIMTTQPNFVPGKAVSVKLDGKADARIRMVDCVGYIVSGAEGVTENGEHRMVRTPWFEHDIPFSEAAEIGTRKVMEEHATVGIVLTTDGSVADLPREAYIAAEERVIKEMKALGKPFMTILNSAHPESGEAGELARSLAEKYGCPVMLMDVLNMTRADLEMLLSDLLYEFPIRRINVRIAGWVSSLSRDHWLLSDLIARIDEASAGMKVMRDHTLMETALSVCEHILNASFESIDLGSGTLTVRADVNENLFYGILGEACGCEIEDDAALISIMRELVSAKKEYDRMHSAMESVKASGFGIVAPDVRTMALSEPELIHEGSRYGVRIRAGAPSLHIVEVPVETEISPIIGTEAQAADLIKSLSEKASKDPASLWDTDFFGKPLSTLVADGMERKVTSIPPEALSKLRDAMTRMVNEANGGTLVVLI